MENIMDVSPVHQTDLKRQKRYGKFHLHRKGKVAVATPSPNWKETLRQSCLQRAKRRRLDLVRRKRLQLDRFNLMEATDNEEDYARLLVQEELREHGVAMDLDGDVHSGDDDLALGSKLTDDSCCMTTTTTQKQKFPPSDDYYISEEDIYDLMQEVEEMLHRDEELLVEEVLEMERIEQQHIQNQIAEYEQWAHNSNEVDDSYIPCPLCQGQQGLIAAVDANQTFMCGNHMMGICDFRVASSGLSLQQLCDRFRNVYDRHGRECEGELTFGVEKCPSNSRVVAKCSCCDLNVTVL